MKKSKNYFSDRIVKKGIIWESGQAVVLVLLSLSVVLTIVLFVMSRSVTDISTSTEQANSVRAFSAAEAGIENALFIGGNSSGSIGDASYNAIVSDEASGTKSFDYPIPLISGDTMTLWFINHDENGDLVCSIDKPCFKGNAFRVCWGSPGEVIVPALEVSVYYESSPGKLSSIRIARMTIDPDEIRRSENMFSANDPTACGGYAYTKAIDFETSFVPAIDVNVYNSDYGLLFAKIRMVYNSDTPHKVGARIDDAVDAVFPSQGKTATSLGTSGESNRKVSVFQGWPEFPFSGLAVLSLPGIAK